tara:strand:- start:5618 stop:6865 length:1248 start_codon:yes stop_codon:yes gene_type:complete
MSAHHLRKQASAPSVEAGFVAISAGTDGFPRVTDENGDSRSLRPSEVTTIASNADLPTAVAGVISLSGNYEIVDEIDIGSDMIELSDGSIVGFGMGSALMSTHATAVVKLADEDCLLRSVRIEAKTAGAYSVLCDGADGATLEDLYCLDTDGEAIAGKGVHVLGNDCTVFGRGMYVSGAAGVDVAGDECTVDVVGGSIIGGVSVDGPASDTVMRLAGMLVDTLDVADPASFGNGSLDVVGCRFIGAVTGVDWTAAYAHFGGNEGLPDSRVFAEMTSEGESTATTSGGMGMWTLGVLGLAAQGSTGCVTTAVNRVTLDAAVKGSHRVSWRGHARVTGPASAECAIGIGFGGSDPANGRFSKFKLDAAGEGFVAFSASEIMAAQTAAVSEYGEVFVRNDADGTDLTVTDVHLVVEGE